MLQILQSLKTGQTELAEIPCPGVKPGQLLIRTRVSLISAGTERMLVEFGKGNLLNKARQQPDKVKQAVAKAKTDGLLTTIEAIRNKLDQALTMGYCQTGTVMAVGQGVSGFKPGDRVASNGKHVEAVCVPVNLCAKVPDAVGDEEAAFTVLGAIALQGVRLAQPTLGEAFAVTGLGLLGLLTVQLLRAHGCRVLGMDFDPARLALAKQFGAETVDLSAGQDPIANALAFSRGRGVDGVLLTAATDSSEPLHQAAQMSRKRGRIVLVGVAGLHLSRADFYEKELSFQVSCSYGPGRYDPNYEEKGQDYPPGFVRWTEQRNFEAVLDLLAEGRLDVKPLISHRFPLAEAESAYALVGGSEPSLGILLHYPSGDDGQPNPVLSRRITHRQAAADTGPGQAVLGFIGAGNYASATLIPAFRQTGARLLAVASSTGVSSAQAARKYGFEYSTTDAESLLADARIHAVVISTRHDSHADWVCRALQAGKRVFVEKPLALTKEQLSQIQQVYSQLASDGESPVLMVGFNRRFAPHSVKLKALLATVRQAKALVMTVNAGAIPVQHWTQDPDTGGGRIVGEACHFIDWLRFLVGQPMVAIQAAGLGQAPGQSHPPDNASLTLKFADGSIGMVHYLANGHKALSKERLEVFCAGRVLQLDNFRQLRGFGWPAFSKLNLWRQDKGQAACAAAFVNAVAHGLPSPIPFDELMEVGLATIAMAGLAED